MNKIICFPSTLVMASWQKCVKRQITGTVRLTSDSQSLAHKDLMYLQIYSAANVIPEQKLREKPCFWIGEDLANVTE
jgi:hypothetical protein